MNSTLKYTYQGKPLLHYCKENSLNYRNVVYRICSGIPIEQAIKKDLVLKKGKPKMKQEFKDEIYSLAYSHRKAKKVADLLYKNSTIYLDRKYEKYLDFCRHYKEL